MEAARKILGGVKGGWREGTALERDWLPGCDKKQAGRQADGLPALLRGQDTQNTDTPWESPAANWTQGMVTPEVCSGAR